MLSEAEGEVETSPGRVPLVYNYVIAVKVLDEMSLSRGCSHAQRTPFVA